MHIVKIVLLVIAYIFCVFVYGTMGPTANIEGGQNKQRWWEALLWPLGIIYRILGGT